MTQKIFKILTILLLFPAWMFAYEESPDLWITAMKVENVDMSVVWVCRAKLETADNGMEYKRVTVDNIDLPRQLGFRSEDRKLYVLDFETGIETVAFDFSLSVGDEFTTMNGMEWVVSEVVDTLYRNEPHKLLNVYSKDGKWEDQWLEGFGSFTNRLMDMDLEGLEISFIPWGRFKGSYWKRPAEITPPPFYGHYSIMTEYAYVMEDITKYPPPKHPLVYEDGKLTSYDYQLLGPAEYHHLFYRFEDDLYSCFFMKFDSLSDATPIWQIDEIVFEGLPEPASGAYRMHIDGKVYDTTDLRTINAGNAGGGKMYDLQGRRLKAEPQKGVFIKDGQKMLKK